jgi:hypothetical protein
VRGEPQVTDFVHWELDFQRRVWGAAFATAELIELNFFKLVLHI